jgi:hypothetical protein
MKFYKFVNEAYYLDRIKDYNLTAIYRSSSSSIQFYKNGLLHNYKNAAYAFIGKYKQFYLNGICYGNLNKFTKQSWRRFVKLKAFL